MKTLAVLGFAVAVAACGTSGGGTTGGAGGSGTGSNPTGGTGVGGTTSGGGTSSGGGTTSGGGGSSTTGGCATALCGGVCCGSGDSCIASSCCAASQSCGSTCCDADSACVVDLAGNPSCGQPCEKSADCGSETPCCEALRDRDGGGTASMGVCAPNPPTPGSYSCRCLTSSECGSGECVPGVNDAGIITGPYVCAADDGGGHAGCGGAPNICAAPNQVCATDQENNQFCSVVCGSDAACGNTGVACCNTSCNLDEVCCGLCGS